MKGVDCFHLMCETGLNSDNSEMVEIWLSSERPLKTAHAPMTSHDRSGT